MADDEAASDIFELRARQVRLAVDVLVLALGGEGATFQRQVQVSTRPHTATLHTMTPRSVHVHQVSTLTRLVGRLPCDASRVVTL